MQSRTMVAGPAEAVRRYLELFYSGDLKSAGSFLAEEFSFVGPFVQTVGREAFLASARPLAAAVRGHRLLRQWEDAGEVCSIFELRLSAGGGSGTVVLCEWHEVHEGRIAKARALFDSAAFRALLPKAP